MSMSTITTGLDLRRYTQYAHADVNALRLHLKRLNAWPEAGDQFLNLIPQSRCHEVALTESDFQWLPVVIQAVLAGTDIGARYPAFFQKLLTNEQLRQAFIDQLENEGPTIK